MFLIPSLLLVLSNVLAHDDQGSMVDDSVNVVILGKDNFDKIVSENKYVLVEFYAPWCGHCKSLAPHYNKAADTLHQSGSNVVLAKIDATVEKDLAEKFQVQGFPTLIWFVNGVKDDVEFEAARTDEGIIDFVKEMTSPVIQEVSTLPENNGKKPQIVYSGSTVSDIFVNIANANRKFGSYYYLPSSNVKLTITHSGEDEILIPSNLTEEEITDFISANSFPLFGELDGSTYSKYIERGYGIVWVLFDIEKSEDLKDAANAKRSEYTSMAKEFSNKLSFIYVDTVTFKQAIEGMLGITSFPSIGLNIKAGDKKKYVYEGDFNNFPEIKKFFHDCLDGKIQALLKSEPVPDEEINSNSPVKVFVGLNLESELFQSDKDVFLEVYAPWCGHCKKLDPEYKALGEKIKSTPGLSSILTLAKMDGTTNDSPIDELTWEGFPTLVYVKAGIRQIIPYDGDRTAKGIWKFLKQNHSMKDKLQQIVKESKASKGKGEEKGEEL